MLLLPRLLLLLAIAKALFSQTGELDRVRQGFAHPPGDARIMMRWWWFGPAVSDTEIARELKVMHDAGIGGVEIQPVYPLQLDDPAKGIQNDPYLSPAFLAHLRFANQRARQLGMRVDITLGSGWPYGGPHVPATEAASRLRCERVAVDASTHSLPLPAMENGEDLIAVFLVKGELKTVRAAGAQRLTDIQHGRVVLNGVDSGPQTVLFFIASRTGQQVKRSGAGAEGFVLDHFDAKAVQHHLEKVGKPLLSAFGEQPPYSVFSDSLEVFSTDWTPDFLKAFQARRGYDLTPYLPELAADVASPATAGIRHDWAQTLTELAEENYLKPIRAWAKQNKTRFRSQTYGEPSVYLSSNAAVDLPEGEAGPHWRSFSTARWASSASHLYGRNVTSTETWTWLHSPAFRATPLDMKAEADLHFLQGINQLIGHGWPYSPPEAGEPGQRFYAAGAFNEHNPWFGVMPDLAAYLQRISYVMRQGMPANDIAVYLPTDDVLAASTLGHVSIDRAMSARLGPHLIPAILDAGYNFDYIDDRAIQTAGIACRVLVLPAVERMPPATLERLRTYIARGGTVIALRQLPSLAPGFQNAAAESRSVSVLAKQLFSPGQTHTRLIADETRLGDELHKILQPDFGVDPKVASVLGFIHRKSPDFDIYFVANTSNRPVETKLKLRAEQPCAARWDAFTGTAATSRSGQLSLAPYESAILVPGPCSALAETESGGRRISLDRDWNLTFLRNGKTMQMPDLESWTATREMRFYSGEVSYERTFDFDGKHAALDFGEGEPIPAPPATGEPGMRALLESPVREAAVVYVNGERAGAVWHPPYRIDISPFVRRGSNRLRIVVGNTAINELAGESLPTYVLLNRRYGERFRPQGFDHIEPLPSGILGKLKLVVQ